MTDAGHERAVSPPHAAGGATPAVALRFAGLFDAEWYSARNPDAEGAAGALAHYLERGARERRDPSALFDTAWYLEQDHEWDAPEGETPLDRYLDFGEGAGLSPHPLFDPRHYAAQAGVRSGSALAHYALHGASADADPHPLFSQAWYRSTHMAGEPARGTPLAHFRDAWLDPDPPRRRPSPHPLFDMDAYLARHPDVAASAMSPFLHYHLHGRAEGRVVTPLFDADFYRARHPDSPAAQADPFGHYLAHGALAGHDPNPFFDNGGYASRRRLRGRSALEHFVTEGEAAGAAPHPLWDGALYLQANPDLAEALRMGRIDSAYAQFVEHGAHELEAGRMRRFSFVWGDRLLDYDRATYLADNPDVEVAIARGRARTPIEHLFTLGHREARDGLRAIYAPRHEVQRLGDERGEAQPGGTHLCLFAHYDRDGVVAPYVVTLVRTLRELGMDVVFVSATASPAELDRVRPHVTRILLKTDAGRDFGSWVLALETLGLDCGRGYDRVLMVNDSFYFPVRPVPDLMEQMRRCDYDLFALSDSKQGGVYHLQSFFLAFSRRAQEVAFPYLASEFRRRYALPKLGQICEFEQGLTELVQRAGLSAGALLSVDQTRERLIHEPQSAAWAPLVRFGLGDVNPSHQLFEYAIGQLGWPALKVELLRDNPCKVRGLKRVRELVADGAVPYAEIREHQTRLARRARPRIRPVEPLGPAEEVRLRGRVPGKGVTDARRLVLFAHYDPDGIVDLHVIHQLRALAANDCTVALVTSTDDPEALAPALPLVSEVIVKNEAGRDFGSWHLALRLLKEQVRRFSSLIFMNDSTYFPMSDPGFLFDEMTRRRADFWGVVDSDSDNWHVMSWFWAFEHSAIRAGWLDWFLSEYNPNHSKWAQIHNYELRLPQLIRASGLQAEAYVPSARIADLILERDREDPRAAALRTGRFNAMHLAWEEALVDFGCPSLKVELVRDNPLGIDLSRLLAVVGERTSYDVELIRRHMLRVKCRHLPPPGAQAALAI